MVYIIGVAGGTASGKTSTCYLIQKQLNQHVLILSMDSFYKGVSPYKNPDDINFDHPEQFNWDLMISIIKLLKKGDEVDVPIYDFTTHSITGFTHIKPETCIILEGILTLYDERVRELLDIKVFVDTPSDVRLVRRIKRDIQERGRTLESVLEQCEKTVIPSYDQFIEPTKKYADLIIPRGKTNVTAISVMVNQIKGQL